MNLRFTRHALRKMIERDVRPAEVKQVLEGRDVIEDYPSDMPYPSALYLDTVGSRPLHVVATKQAVGGKIIVITVYEPDPARWDATLRRRR